MRVPFVAGNWKMNTDLESATSLARAAAGAVPAETDRIEVLVCPPFPYLSAVGAALAGSGVELGAQNVYCEPPGAYTGEVAVEMLLDMGCRWVIIGHSERRHILGETDELINKKTAVALKQGLGVILCVGELLQEREAGRTEAVLDAQMNGGLAGLDAAALNGLAIAYEPVWAIGTGKTASPDQANSAHQHLRKWLEDRYNTQTADGMRILYGGSVKPDNALELLQQPHVDGALVGGASLQSELFLPIIDAARQVAGA